MATAAAVTAASTSASASTSTAATSAVAATTSTAAISPATTAGPWRPFAGFIDRERSAAHVFAVEGLHRRIHSLFGFHFDESEAA